MQEFTVTKGATSVIVPVSIYDSSSTTGAKLAGLAFNTGSLTAYYNRMGASGGATAITLATATKGTWTSGGFVAIDGTNMPGDYELHIPDAALATGANEVAIQLKGAANMVPKNIVVHLTGTNRQDAVRGGMTALPNAAAEAAGGLYTRGTGSGQINQSGNGLIDSRSMALDTQAKADVNAEVVDALGVDTITEQGAANPPVAPTMRQVLSYLYMRMIRNKKTVDASASPAVETIFADNGTTPVFKRNITDAANVTTFDETVTG
jgi:hypothetical protein